MARRLLALAALLPSLALTGCETSTSVELKTIRITQPGIPVAGDALLGVPLTASTTFDLGEALVTNITDAATVELTAKSLRVSWSDPANHPDFSGITSVTARVVPGAGSGLPDSDIATYRQNPSDPDPDTFVFSVDSNVEVFALMASGVMTLELSATGSIPASFDTTATGVIEFNMLVEVEPADMVTGGI